MSKMNISTVKNPALVLGIGECGCNIVQDMAEAAKMEGTATAEKFRFEIANTDRRALKTDDGIIGLLLGGNLAKGLGARGNPDTSRQAAEESREAIAAAMQGAPAVFLVAGMGGSTSTGAVPVFVEVAKELQIPLIAIVIRPFYFEAKIRLAIASDAVAALGRQNIMLVVIPNDRLIQNSANTTLIEAYKRQADFAWKIVQASWPTEHAEPARTHTLKS